MSKSSENYQRSEDSYLERGDDIFENTKEADDIVSP